MSLLFSDTGELNSSEVLSIESFNFSSILFCGGMIGGWWRSLPSTDEKRLPAIWHKVSTGMKLEEMEL